MCATKEMTCGWIRQGCIISWDPNALYAVYAAAALAGLTLLARRGSIILGIGGDNSDSAIGTCEAEHEASCVDCTFARSRLIKKPCTIVYEGCMTSGLASNATDAKVQANIVAAGYGH